jgi:hypothetical protein
MVGKTALDCLRMHCHGDYSAEGRRGDVDGVMKRIATTFQIDQSFAALPTLEERCDAFVKTALDCGLLIDLSGPARAEGEPTC